MSFTIPPVSFPVRWSCFCVMCTRNPGLMSLRCFPSMHSLLSPFGSGRNAVFDWANYRETTIACHNRLVCVRSGSPASSFLITGCEFSRGAESETQLVQPAAVGKGRPVAAQVEFGLQVQGLECWPLRLHHGAVLGNNGVLPGKEVWLWHILAVIPGHPHPGRAFAHGVGGNGQQDGKARPL